MPRGGRPSKLTPTVHKRCVDLFREGHTHRAVAWDIGVHTDTLAKWINRGSKDDADEPYKKFTTDVWRARAVVIKQKEIGVRDAETKEEQDLNLTWLRHRYKEEWGDINHEARNSGNESEDALKSMIAMLINGKLDDDKERD